MENRRTSKIIFVGIGLLFTCLVLGLGAWYFLSGNSQFAGQTPTIVILQPAPPVDMESGAALVLQVQGDSNLGIDYIDLFANGEFYYRSAAGNGEKQFVVTIPWFSAKVGEHQLSVISYDIAGNTSEPALFSVNILQAFVGNNPDRIILDENTDVAALFEPDSVEEQILAEIGDRAADENQPGQGAPDPAAQNDPPAPAAPLPAVPAGDEPPIVFSLGYGPSRIQGGFFGHLFGESRDDIGLSHMTLVFLRPNGEMASLEIPCNGEVVCTMDLGAVPMLPGQWNFTLQSMDTANQQSEIAVMGVEVLGQPGQDPGAAVPAPGLPGQRQEELIDIGLDDFGPMNAEDILEAARRAAEGNQEEQVEEIQPLTLEVRSQDGGNEISVTANQDFEAEPGEYLVLRLSREFPLTLRQKFTSIVPENWLDSGLINIENGAVFETFDPLDYCGEPISYHATLFSTDIPPEQVLENPGEIVNNGADFIGLSGWIASEMPACQPGDLGNIALELIEVQGGIQVSWTLPPKENWPADLLSDGLLYLAVYRYNPLQGYRPPAGAINFPVHRSTALWMQADFDFSAGATGEWEARPENQNLITGGWDEEFILFDEPPICTGETYYSVAVTTVASIQPNLDELILFATEKVPLRNLWRVCSIPFLEIVIPVLSNSVSPQGFSQVEVNYAIPPGSSIPEGNQPTLDLFRIERPSDGGEEIITAQGRIHLTDDVLAQGKQGPPFTEPTLNCGTEYAYQFVLTIANEIVATGQWVEITTPPC